MNNEHLNQLVITAISAQDIEILAEQFPLQITAEEKNDKAVIRISGAIHQWQNSANWFRQQIATFNERGITEGELHISTPGGDVFQAAEIHNEIKAFAGNITGYGGVIVASAGTYLRLACENFYLVANGKWMYHKPSGGIRGNEDAWESGLKLLKNITSDYRKGYADLTGLQEDEIEKRWAKGDVWLTAEEAKKEGWITGISAFKAKITEKETAMFTACGMPDPPKPTKRKPKFNIKTEMDLKATALRLGLDENATEAEVNAEMAKLRAKAGRVDQLELEATQKAENDRKQKIADIKAQAIKDKKMTAKTADSMDKWAETDFEGWKAHVESLPTLQKLSETVTGKAAKGGAIALKDKKYEDMTDTEREVLADEDPELFEAKYTTYLEN
ncbi:ATP-dependent Clp protease proteolytic subunit [Mesonia sp.]|uniref:ATP-dependent Clp protease proteolytic subunit n=1 Tax=Mesonia sp. TaxID=1960830 RepID=UPI0025C588DF|nr:ATP-dependent Clp protease proteolytic subunit [Mesonia sp.]